MSDPTLTYNVEGEKVRIDLINFLKKNGVKQSYVAGKTNLSNCSISLFINSKRILIPRKLELIKELIYQDVETREECNYCNSDIGESILNYSVGKYSYMLYIENKNELVLLEYDESGVQVDNIVEINYCPMCGRTLS